jgi:hypothetical protein
VAAESAAAPERAVEIHVKDIEPVLIGDLLGRRLAAGFFAASMTNSQVGASARLPPAVWSLS